MCWENLFSERPGKYSSTFWTKVGSAVEPIAAVSLSPQLNGWP
jgi:hypothetical protein